MQIETVTRKGREFGLVPLKELKKLLADAEMLADIAAYDAAMARLESGEDELIPLELIERQLAGESPIKLWRRHRKMTQENLANISGVSRVMIAAIEAGRKRGSIGTLKKLSSALNVDMEQIA